MMNNPQSITLRAALIEAIAECREHNAEYGHITDEKKLAKWEAVLATLAPCESPTVERIIQRLDKEKHLSDIEFVNQNARGK